MFCIAVPAVLPPPPPAPPPQVDLCSGEQTAGRSSETKHACTASLPSSPLCISPCSPDATAPSADEQQTSPPHRLTSTTAENQVSELNREKNLKRTRTEPFEILNHRKETL